MSNTYELTKQTEYKTWKQDTSQPLPESLKYVFIEKILLYAFKQQVIIDKLFNYCNKVELQTRRLEKVFYTSLAYDDEGNDLPENETAKILYKRWDDFVHYYERQIVILFFLSRTLDGQAVMPFLNKKIVLDNGNGYLYEEYLDKEMLKQFVLEGTGVGKSFEESLEIVTKTYLLHFYG